MYLGDTTTWQRRKKLAESVAKSTHQPDAVQHARAHEPQLTLSFHNLSLRAHLKLMLYSDVPLQSTSINGERLPCTQHSTRSVMEKMERKREGGRRGKSGNGGKTRKEKEAG